MLSPPFRALAGREPRTARWLKHAGDVCDVFVSMDGNIEHQQNLATLSFGVVVIDAPSNRVADLLPVVPELLQAIDAVRPGEIRHVGKSPKRHSESGQAT